MSRLSLLLPILIYLTFEPAYARRPVGLPDLLIFFAVFLALPLIGRFLSLRIAHISSETALHIASDRLQRLLGTARLAALLWTAAGMYALGWGDLVYQLTSRFHPPNTFGPSFLGALLATLPAYACWILLHWAQYPAERALREQAILVHLEAAFPVRSPPTLRQYLLHQLRTGPGLFVIPVLAVLLFRDLSHLALSLAHIRPTVWLESLLYLTSTLAVFILSPLLMVRVLATRPLPPGELRDRLTRLATRSGVRFHDVLLWDTGHTACNALVTGLVPRFRYVLLSDLLLESLPDDAIEAVFAHELGHIVHRHIPWYGGFLISTALLLQWLDLAIAYLAAHTQIHLPLDLTGGALSLAIILLAFGSLSRRFERQADVYAARAMQSHPEAHPPLSPHTPSNPPPNTPSHNPSEIPPMSPLLSPNLQTPPPPSPLPSSPPPAPLPPTLPLSTPVGYRGASTFSAALQRVAWVNNLPLEARNFTHGSIASRIRAVLSLAPDPTLTHSFDTTHRRLRAALSLLLLAALATLIFF